MKDDSQVRLWPKVRLRILSSTLEALLVRPLPGRGRGSFHGQKAVLGHVPTGFEAFCRTPRGFHAPALQTASRLMYLSFYQHSVSAVGFTEQVIVKRLRRDYYTANRCQSRKLFTCTTQWTHAINYDSLYCVWKNHFQLDNFRKIF